MSDDGSDQDSPQQSPVATGGGKSLLSRIFAALAHQRRRYVLYYLRDHEEATLTELAHHIAAWEQDSASEPVPAAIEDRVRMDLTHSHLPKLEDYGLVEYDRRSESVCYTYPPSLLDEALQLTAPIEDLP